MKNTPNLFYASPHALAEIVDPPEYMIISTIAMAHQSVGTRAVLYDSSNSVVNNVLLLTTGN